MSEIDPDIQMPDEEPNSPADQSPPRPPDEMTDADAEDTLENMRELVDQISSLSKESDGEALKEIESQLPQNQEPGEGNTATDSLEPDARQNEMVDQALAPIGEQAIESPESVENTIKTEGIGDSYIASLDDDIDLLLEDIDKVVVQAVSDTSDSSGGEIPVAGDAMSVTATEALSSQEEPVPQNDSEDPSGVIATDAGDAGEVGESAGLDPGGDEIIAETETQDATVAPSPSELESSSEQATPVESVENKKPPVTSEAADTGGVETSTDISSEFDAPLSQVKSEQPAKTTVSKAQDTDQSPDMASKSTQAESGEPTRTPILKEQKKGSTPKEIKPHSNATQAQDDLAMRALDEAMADDVAQMIAGDTDAIEAVLDGIFDEQAILVQNDEDFMNESALGGMIQSDNPVEESGAKSGSPSDSPTETASDVGEVIDEEIAAIGSPETRKETSTASVSDRPETDEKSIDQAAQKPAAATKVARAAEAEAVTGEPQLAPAERKNKWLERVQAAFEIIEPPLITVLSGLNYPLRKIPKKLRPAMDWLALSLVFWVPIVWVLALFVVK